MGQGNFCGCHSCRRAEGARCWPAHPHTPLQVGWLLCCRSVWSGPGVSAACPGVQMEGSALVEDILVYVAGVQSHRGNRGSWLEMGISSCLQCAVDRNKTMVRLPHGQAAGHCPFNGRNCGVTWPRAWPRAGVGNWVQQCSPPCQQTSHPLSTVSALWILVAVQIRSGKWEVSLCYP